MTISIFALHLYQERFGGDKGLALDFAREQGISSVEIFDSELKDVTLHDYRQLVEDHGLSISTVIIASNFAFMGEAEYQKELVRIKALINDAAAEGIKMVMIVPLGDGAKSEEEKFAVRDRIIQGLNEAAEYSKGSGVAITLENFSRKDLPLGTIEEMEYILDRVSGVKYNYDSGNFYFRYVDVLEAYEALKERIVNIHIKDWKNDENGPYGVPGRPQFTGASIGDGVLPLKELLSRLKGDGYEGQLVIEINPELERAEMIEESVAFIRGQLS